RAGFCENFQPFWSKESMSRHITSHSVVALALCATTALAACSSGSDSGMSPSTSGSVSIALTDAPFPFDSVARADIYVVRIDGRTADVDSAGAEAQKDDDSHANTDPSKDWVTLAAPNAAFNLLDLQNGKSVNLGQASLASGTYRGFRIVIDA